MKIAIASGKGGTGKTAIAVNLASFLAEKELVCLVDLDVEAPDTTQFFPMEHAGEQKTYRLVPFWEGSNCTHCTQCISICQFNALAVLRDDIFIFPALCHSCEACIKLCKSNALKGIQREMGAVRAKQFRNLLLVEGICLVGEEHAVPQIRETIANAGKIMSHISGGRNAGSIIMDSPPGTACPAVAAMHTADVVVLVTEPTPFGLHDLKAAVGTARILNHNPYVIINRCDIGNDCIHQYCKEESLQIIAELPYQREVAELYAAGKVIIQYSNIWREAMRSITEFLQELSLDAYVPRREPHA